MHLRIRKFYDKWKRFYADKHSAKSIPSESDSRYKTPFKIDASQSENFRQNWRADDSDYIEGDEEWTGA